MDINDDSEAIIRRSFKCEEPVFDNLNVVYNASSTTTTLWNKYQIFVYENLEFENASRVIIPEFQIDQIITSNNYLLSVDCAGNVHTISLKFKSAASKRSRSSFLPRIHNVMASALFGEDYAICLKYESDAYFLSVHKITTEFNSEKIAIIMCKESLPFQQSREKYILKSCPITASHFEDVKKGLNIEQINIRNNYSLVIISFDRQTIYSCLFSCKMDEDEVNLVKLYTCPSQIASIDFLSSENLNILIGLKMGTFININLKDITSPEVIHFNTAIHKFLVYEHNIIYTDSLSMWKAENILSKDIKFNQLFVKNVRDFTKFGDQLVCTTFDNLIYTFPIDDENSYIKAQSETEYCPAEKLFNNLVYHTKAVDETEESNKSLKILTQEKSYITALSLSNRQDLMNTVIQQKVIVYENYDDAVSENDDVILTNTLSEYLDDDSFYFLVKVTVSTVHRFLEILSNSLGDLRIHITLLSDGRVAKTTTIKIKDLTKNITLLIPLKNKYVSTTEMKVNFKIMTNMPGIKDAKQKIWSVLYRRSITLYSEHFIKFSLNENKIISLRTLKESLEDLIAETAMNQYGSIIKIMHVYKNPEYKKWQMYVRLPETYLDVLQNENTAKYCTSRKVKYFLQRFTSEHFLKSQSSIILPVGKEKFEVEIYNDGFSTPCLKITSNDVQITLNIRNFLSNFIYNIFTDFEPGKQFINHSFYVTVENLKKAIRECITSSSEDDILPLIEQFERKVVGLLPI